jgi:hypothetical protein
VLNMTYLALNLSHYVNGVAKRHQEVSQQMFGRYPIDAITNGIHAATWATPAFQTLFDRWIPGWRDDNSNGTKPILAFAARLVCSHRATAHDESDAHAPRRITAEIRRTPPLLPGNLRRVCAQARRERQVCAVESSQEPMGLAGRACSLLIFPRDEIQASAAATGLERTPPPGHQSLAVGGEAGAETPRLPAAPLA